MPNNPSHILTNRERQVISFLAQGLTSKEVAVKLVISLHTVLSHRKNVCDKLGVKSSVQLGVKAERLGLIYRENIASFVVNR